MRSIRRSMTEYMLVLLAVTLGVAWVVIDQVTARALAAREAAGAELIRNQYDEKCQTERERIDQAQLRQAKELHRVMTEHYQRRWDAEFADYRRLADTVHWSMASAPFADTIAAFASITRGGPGAPSLLSRMYFANLPLPEEDIRHFDEESRGVDYFQINTLAGREWHSQSL